MKNGTTHVFDNGIKVYENQLLDLQKERYRLHNVHEAEEEGVFVEMISDIPRGGTYVNVGAAIGYYPLLAASIREDLNIVAYEPLSTHRRFFRKNILLNGYTRSNFCIHSEGLYSRPGSVNFNIEHYGSMIREDKSKKGFFRKLKERLHNERIICITMEQLSRREPAGIDLLQMDIQGIEARVLEASEGVLGEHVIRNFLIGTHSADIHQRCINILRKHGYHIMLDIFETIHQPDGILTASCETP